MTYYMKLLLCLFSFSVCMGYLSQYFSKYYNIYLSLLGLPYKYKKNIYIPLSTDISILIAEIFYLKKKYYV